MVEANTQALIEALAVVMRDFNTKIDEQYGENFKRLNESVGSMLQWQKEYKQQLVELADNQQKIGHSMREVRDSLQHLEGLVKMNVKLKNELKVNSQSYWKNTHKALNKISERLVKLANKVGQLQ